MSFDIVTKIGKLEDTRNRTLHGILRVQSCFRGHQARHHARERIGGVLALQSCKFSQITILTYFTFYSCCIFSLFKFTVWSGPALLNAVIRGENARHIYSSLSRKHRATVILQRNVRCWLARRYFINLRKASVIIQSGRKILDHLIL